MHNYESGCIYIPENKHFNNRKELKDYLGGTSAYNRAMKMNQIYFINYKEKDNGKH